MGTASSGEIKIVPAREEDGKEIYRIGTLCFSDAWRKETVEKDMAAPHSLYLTARRGDTVLGYACYWFVADEAQLVNIGVLPEARRQGLAEALLTAGLAAAEERHMASMYLEVRLSNLAAQGLYRKHGFHVLTVRKGVYDLPREDGYIMSRPIGAVSKDFPHR